MSDLLTTDTSFALNRAAYSGSEKAAQALQTAKDSRDTKKIDEAAKEFEAVFVAEMMKPMFEGLSTDGPFGGGKGEEIFRGMMLQEYGKMVAKTDTIGISSHVKQEMIKLQEHQNHAQTQSH